MTWLLEALEQSHLVQMAMQGMVDCMAIALDLVVVTLGRQPAQQEAVDNLLYQLLPQTVACAGGHGCSRGQQGA